MSNQKILTYKGFIGSAEIDLEDELISGKILFIDDSIGYDSESVSGIYQSFTEAVDDYISFCAKIGKEPNTPFSGKTAIRLDPELHRNIAIASLKEGKSMNEFMVHAITNYLNNTRINSAAQSNATISLIKEAVGLCQTVSSTHDSLFSHKMKVTFLDTTTSLGHAAPLSFTPPLLKH